MRLGAALGAGLATKVVRGATRAGIPAALAAAGIGAVHAEAARQLLGNSEGGEWACWSGRRVRCKEGARAGADGTAMRTRPSHTPTSPLHPPLSLIAGKKTCDHFHKDAFPSA